VPYGLSSKETPDSDRHQFQVGSSVVTGYCNRPCQRAQTLQIFNGGSLPRSSPATRLHSYTAWEINERQLILVSRYSCSLSRVGVPAVEKNCSVWGGNGVATHDSNRRPCLIQKMTPARSVVAAISGSWHLHRYLQTASLGWGPHERNRTRGTRCKNEDPLRSWT
jgi:hypothetical protein